MTTSVMNGRAKRVLVKDFKEGLIQKLDELRKSNVLCDVTIRAEGQDFPAHRCVLSIGSPYFRTLFTSELKVREIEENLIKLTDITSEAFTKVLQYLYTGEAYINSANALDIVAAADYLMIPSLKLEACIFLKACADFMIDSSNCLALESFSSKYNCKLFKQAVVSYFHENFVAVSMSEDFQSLGLKEVKELLCDDKINVPQEEEVYKAMMRWVKHDLESRECALPELLKCVRLFSMSKDSLCQILEEEELIKKSPSYTSIVVSGLDYLRFPDQFQGTSLTPCLSVGENVEYENVVVLTGGLKPNNESRNNTHSFVLSTKLWQNLSSTAPECCRNHNAAVCGGLLYVFGGSSYYSEIHSFNPKQRKWNSIGDCHLGKDCSVTTFNEVLYLTGGEDDWNRTQIYYPIVDK